MSYSADVELAVDVATVAHHDAVDKSGDPYILHPKRVAERMDTPEEKVVAWLHDVVEDTGVTINTICEMFGDETAKAVNAISRRKGESWSDYLIRVKANPMARAVKISDLIDNSNLGRFKKPTKEDVMRQAKYNRALYFLMEVE